MPGRGISRDGYILFSLIVNEKYLRANRLCTSRNTAALAEQLSQRCATGHRSAVTLLHHQSDRPLFPSLSLPPPSSPPPFTIYPPSFSIPHSDPPTSSPLAPSRSSTEILLGSKGGGRGGGGRGRKGALLPRAFKGKGVGSVRRNRKEVDLFMLSW